MTLHLGNMMALDIGDVYFTKGAHADLNFTQQSPTPPQDNWPLGQFSLRASSTSTGPLNSVTVTLGGTYSGLSGATPFRVYVSNTNNFASASPIGSDAAEAGGSVTFSSLNDAIPTTMRYYWVTVDLSSSASGTIDGTIPDEDALDISNYNFLYADYGQLNAGSDASLPVELVYFSARLDLSSVILEWVTESEVDNLGFILERRTVEANGNSSVWRQIAGYQTNDALKGHGNTSQRTQYTFTDSRVQDGFTYQYRLGDVDINGKIEYHDAIEVTAGKVVPTLPEKFALLPAFPNPFNPSTELTFTLPEAAEVQLAIYNLSGQLVRTLAAGQKGASIHKVTWDAKAESGLRVAGGIYLAVFQANDFVAQKKLVLAR